MIRLFQHKNKQATQPLVSCFLAFILSTSLGYTSVHAQITNPKDNLPSTYTLLEPLPCIPSPAAKDTQGKEIPGTAVVCSGQQKTTVSFQDYVQYAFNLLIALAAVAAVFRIVWGGFEHMTSTSPAGKTEGIKKVENAIYGLLLVLASYLILKTIDPRLVQIPTTLVAPLDIKYKPGEVAAFLQQLTDDVNRLRNENTQLREGILLADKELKRLDTERVALCDQLVASYRKNFVYDPNGVDSVDSINALSCAQLLSDLTLLDPASNILAAKIINIDHTKQDIQTKITSDTAVGSMNSGIQQCNGITDRSSNVGQKGLTLKQCLEIITDAKTKYARILENNGDGLAAQNVREYSTYAESIARINAAVKVNMASSPNVTAAVDTLQSAVTIASTAVGAVYGGGVAGGALGFARAQVFNGVITTAQIASNNSSAKLTVSQIQLEVNNNVNKITNPKIKELYETQAYALIKILGGKGDGTDSTKPAIDNDQLQQRLDNALDIPMS